MKYLGFFLMLILMGCMDRSSADQATDMDPSLLGLVDSKSSNYEFTERDEGVQTFSVTPQEENVSNTEQKIIKTADLRFETSDLEETHKGIVALTKQLNGFVSTDRSGKSSRELYHNITIRIPTENFQEFIDGVSKGVSYFDRKDISRRDVTEEFVDLEARLKAKHELEKRYLELLKQARNVKEMLEIERELSTIREEIEAKQGRLNYLKDQVSMSTVNIQFYKYTTKTGVTVSYGQKMKNALAGGWDGVSMFFLGLLYLWPLFVVIGIVIWLVRRMIKRSRKKKLIKAQKTE